MCWFPLCGRHARGLVLLVPALFVSGCPMFSSNAGCWYDGDCAPGFVCNRSNGACIEEPRIEPSPCEVPDDCDSGETCSPDALCLPGDCTFAGCVTGFECGVQDGRWQCVLRGAGGGAGQAGAAGSEGSD